jgi:hypothetical protein
MKILLFVSTCLEKVYFFFYLHRIRENKRKITNILEVRSLFGSFCTKSAKILPQLVSGRSTFYSALFELCGRTIGQLATLEILCSFFVWVLKLKSIGCIVLLC